MTRRTRITAAAVLTGLALVAAGCGGDDGGTADTTAAGGGTTVPADDTVTEEGISPERCEANRAAGKITYLSSFDFAAAASILDVVVADEKGYFEKLCLDVELKPSFSTVNYPLVAAGQAQFSSAGSYTELLNFSKDGAEFVALVAYGKTPIEALLTKPEITSLADLKGTTIGVKGDIPPSIVALLNSAGLTRGTDYDEVLLDGFDPKVHIQQPVAGFPVYKSNEPGQLEAAGVDFTLFDPTDEGIPGSFGILYTSKTFLTEHPTAAADFVRAALRGMEDAIADPPGAVASAVARINAAGNQNFLTEEGETFRWQQELAEVRKGTPAGEPVGLIDPAKLEAEVQAYAAAGVFDGAAPATAGTYEASLARSLYNADGKVIFPR